MRPPTKRRERPLIYGRFNSGKTAAWLSIAREFAETESENKIYVGDTDNIWNAAASNELEPYVNATHITDYRSAVNWARDTRKLIDWDDWVAVDMIDQFWPWSQEHYFKQRYGDDDLMLADIYLEDAKAKAGDSDSSGMAGSHGRNWGDIYQFYFGLLNLVANMPCHVIGCAAAKTIRPDTKGGIVSRYKDTGHYPAGPPEDGEKAISHKFHSVIYTSGTESWRYTTIKEAPCTPPRRLMKGEKVEDFVSTYLYGVAGWRP